jgi:NAD(P)-dependent dehydrogenase (short-subunit alcohol dehydrogenase family)
MGVVDLLSLSRKFVLITGAGHRLGEGFATAVTDAGTAVACSDIDGTAALRGPWPIIGMRVAGRTWSLVQATPAAGTPLGHCQQAPHGTARVPASARGGL